MNSGCYMGRVMMLACPIGHRPVGKKALITHCSRVTAISNCLRYSQDQCVLSRGRHLGVPIVRDNQLVNHPAGQCIVFLPLSLSPPIVSLFLTKELSNGPGNFISRQKLRLPPRHGTHRQTDGFVSLLSNLLSSRLKWRY